MPTAVAEVSLDLEYLFRAQIAEAVRIVEMADLDKEGVATVQGRAVVAAEMAVAVTGNRERVVAEAGKVPQSRMSQIIETWKVGRMNMKDGSSVVSILAI